MRGIEIPTILVTAYPDDAERARALNDGIVCYLRKPPHPQSAGLGGVERASIVRC
jgi:CheY-like chemotaxis protein